MAWRNLWRNQRRTFITLASIAFGVLLAATMGGITNYKYKEMVDQNARMGVGHISVQPQGYLAAPSLKLRLSAVTPLRQRLLAEPGVLAAYPHLQGPALFASAARNVGGLFIALDPAIETKDDNVFLGSIDSGTAFSRTDEASAVIGDGLARKLKLRLGQKMVVTANDIHGQMASVLVRICGTFHTGVTEVDESGALLPLGTAGALLGYEKDQATSLALMLADNRESRVVAARLQTALQQPNLELKPWNETLPQVDGLIKVDKISRRLVLLVLGLMIAMGVLNTSLMSVIERRREFGVMLALGLSPWNLVRLVLTEALLTGLLGLAAGAVVSAPWIRYLMVKGLNLSGLIQGGIEVNGALFKPQIYAILYPETLLTIAAITLALVLAAGIYPAWKAGSVPPMDAIRND